MVTFPNAKINIGLNILRKRPDGYHDIDTLFYPVNWTDILEIVPSHGTKTTLRVTGRTVKCNAEDNLVMKAFNKLNEKIPLPACDIFLHKIIPDGAGLGGGSSDAAFTLLTLNNLFELELGKEDLAAIAMEIGADCPFFIYNQPMFASGTGTILEKNALCLSNYHIAIVKPDILISTKEAYSKCSPKIPSVNLKQKLTERISQWKEIITNDFESAFVNDYPELHDIKRKLYDFGAIYASMTGSGSAIYGIFDNDILSDDIKNLFPRYDIYTGKLT